MNKLFSSLLILFSIAHWGAFASEPATFQLINERLSYMRDVALYKAQNHLPVENVAREAIVLEKAQEQAQKLGLDPQTTLNFFKAQISAAKAIQYRYRTHWLSSPDTLQKQPRDLDSTVRPALITLGNQILNQIAVHLREKGPYTEKDRSHFMMSVNVPNLSQANKNGLFESLMEVRLK
ncbi:chorismate mutase [Flexibacterium corallicola]|uniref:chorismate mutase n=1 Tax=Flexibacterium corallicola TaxID=3037259 RepID=UPI00286ECDB0|nr:chorismate mutase [Pseudovibrio sp. M1P-2-3]